MQAQTAEKGSGLLVPSTVLATPSKRLTNSSSFDGPVGRKLKKEDIIPSVVEQSNRIAVLFPNIPPPVDIESIFIDKEGKQYSRYAVDNLTKQTELLLNQWKKKKQYAMLKKLKKL